VQAACNATADTRDMERFSPHTRTAIAAAACVAAGTLALGAEVLHHTFLPFGHWPGLGAAEAAVSQLILPRAQPSAGAGHGISRRTRDSQDRARTLVVPAPRHIAAATPALVPLAHHVVRPRRHKPARRPLKHVSTAPAASVTVAAARSAAPAAAAPEVTVSIPSIKFPIVASSRPGPQVTPLHTLDASAGRAIATISAATTGTPSVNATSLTSTSTTDNGTGQDQTSAVAASTAANVSSIKQSATQP
jgi:hypothetical protein